MDTTELILAGYLAAPRARHADWQSDLVPERFISVSECLTGVEHGPQFWAWHTDREAATRFHGALLAIGLTGRDATDLTDDLRREFVHDVGTSNRNEPEYLDLLTRATHVPHDGLLRGFEVIGIEWGLSNVHSWFCHSYEPDVAAELAIQPNHWGLLDTYGEASTVLDWILDRPTDEAPEPAHWTVAALIECPR
ncbi:hypothetical protein [Saccharomonospora cyanea]|uniref:Uncharacterized protein n=1 Tax=Saccharomonospora cyanea NA-134 TaxID=882082 RepID=H5XN33_9PSEU|nr:hypothetical protein [Saccharomonospora cyanea]EHR63200.1 hypothetical protein SaccyDRAFT_4389 [Saccharomonospora cyanea NA-134]